MTDIIWGAPHFTEKEMARFWSNVAIGASDECWIWNGTMRGAPNRDGLRYGGFKEMNASRYVAELISDRKLDGMMEVARHSCHNPPCVNPAHISVGSQSENARDTIAHGRNPHAAKTHCKSGHPFAGDNLFIRANGMRECRQCIRDRRNASYAKQKKMKGEQK